MQRLSLIFVLLITPLMAKDTFLEWMNHIAQEQLSTREAAISHIHTAAEANARQAQVRAKVLELLGSLPDYHGPLNARVTGVIRLPRYVIEKVIFESLPQLYVTADLYRPNDGRQHPGILFPMGHWDEGKPAAQRMAANLAMKGFVVLAYDPIGQGERLQAYNRWLHASLAGGSTEQHFMAGAQSVLIGENFARYRIWDAKRALDYLLSRPEVEDDKIGATGCSGGGTLTAYISALDPRIEVAAPACYINSFHQVFAGPTGDSEQSFPNFLSSGLDIPDYIEMFAPKPWLISSTLGDFFPIEGAREAYQEAKQWYEIYGASDKVAWAIGPGGHGTPLQVREAIYAWMIRWLEDGHGSAKEEPVEMQTNFALQATESGQVGGRELWQVIQDDYQHRHSPGTPDQLLAEIRRLARLPKRQPLPVRTLRDTPGFEFRTQQIAIEADPGLEISGTLYIPNTPGRKPAVLLVDSPQTQATALAGRGNVVLNLMPRGLPASGSGRSLSGDWISNERAWLIGLNLPAMRAGDIVRGVDVLAERPDVNSGAIRAIARNVPGVWLLMAAAIDPRIGHIWIDHTPYSLRIALDSPISRNLHDAVIPGFLLHWDLSDLVKAAGPQRVIWSDPTDWMGAVVPALPGYLYRTFEEPDTRFLDALMK